MSGCLFCRIAAGEIPSTKVHEDDEILAFEDIAPKAPVHVLVIPKRHIAGAWEFEEADAALLGRLLLVGRKVAAEKGVLERGFRFVMNARDDGGQEVHHVHLHVLGGRRMTWPPG